MRGLRKKYLPPKMSAVDNSLSYWPEINALVNTFARAWRLSPSRPYFKQPNSDIASRFVRLYLSPSPLAN